jgi:hypothetical protein
MRFAACFLSAALLGTAAHAAPARAANELEVDAAHHRLEFENDSFRVVRASFGPREMSDDFFDAEAVVIIALTPLLMRVHFPDGNRADFPPTPVGAAFWAPSGRIRPQNMLDDRAEFVVVVPKGANGRAARIGADPLTVDADNWKVEVDNEAVRALRYRAGPRAKGPKHGHSDHVVVFLTKGKNLVDRPDGQTFVSVRKPGEVVSAPAGEHAPENLLDDPLEVILVERK